MLLRRTYGLCPCVRLMRSTSFTHSQRRLALPALDALGWDATLASAFELLQDDNLFPARIAAQHRGEFVLFAEAGELRARAAGRLFYAHEVGGQLPAVGDWVAVTPP